MNIKPLCKILALLLFLNTTVFADTWKNLGTVASLPQTAVGIISNSCQYRLKSLLSQTTAPGPLDGRGLPGVMYFDSVANQRISTNFGQNLLIRSLDYDLVSGLRSAQAFFNALEAKAALAILRTNANHILITRLVLTEGYSFFGQSEKPSLTVEIAYMVGKKSVRKIYQLQNESFELEASCPS